MLLINPKIPIAEVMKNGRDDNNSDDDNSAFCLVIITIILFLIACNMFSNSTAAAIQNACSTISK
jgi:hypothetical protein